MTPARSPLLQDGYFDLWRFKLETARGNSVGLGELLPPSHLRESPRGRCRTHRGNCALIVTRHNRALREMHSIEEFRLAFCLKILEVLSDVSVGPDGGNQVATHRAHDPMESKWTPPPTYISVTTFALASAHSTLRS